MSQKPDRWVAIALDHQLRPGSANPVVLDGYGLALWRGESGSVAVWEDRCPHRGMRLSFGFVRGDQLRCIYHGWGYGTDGQCQSIPAHPELTPPRTICATTYPSEIRFGMIWTNLHDAANAPLPGDGVEGNWKPLRSLYIGRSPDEVEAALPELDGTGDFAMASRADGLAILERADGLRLLCAVQPVSRDRAALHIVAETPDDAPTRRLDLLPVFDAFRAQLEA